MSLSSDAPPEAGAPRAALTADQVRFPEVEAGPVFHFIQGQAQAVLDFLPQIPASDLCLAISYDRPIAAGEADAAAGRRQFHFWPKSSWAEGRNLGVEAALALGPRIAFAAFLDDDAVFARGDYAGFVDAARALGAAIAVPVAPRTARSKYQAPGRAVQAGAIQDQQVMICRRDVLSDPLIWPMATEYDQTSWHVACLIQEYMIFDQYKGRLAQLNDFEVRNDGHVWVPPEEGGVAESSYVMERDFHRVRKLAFAHVERALGRRPDVANDIFNGIKDVTTLERARRLWWKLAGRALHMRRLRIDG